MRFKIFTIIDIGISFLLGESKKRQYIATWNKENKILGFKMFKKECEEYFLQYKRD